MSASPSASASATPETPAAAAAKPTVEEGSATPEPQTETAQTQDKGKGKATDEVWDPSAQTLPEGSKPTESAAPTSGTATPAVAAVPAAAPAADPSNPWQAVWSAESNAWYFWNAKTGEVTWTNPIATAQDVIIPEGIDPALAHLLDKPDPNQINDPAYQQAKFNAKTGRFTAQNFELTPEYVSELGRMKRMNEMYFDTEEWERKREEEHQKKRKRDADIAAGLIQPTTSSKKPSKKEMKRFRAKRAEKKAHSHAWLRERD